MSFSQLVDSLEISSSNLTYHLDSLGELLFKMDNGVYKLSTFGVASVNTMRIVEEAPSVTEKHRRLPLSLRWKSVLAILAIGVIVFAGFSTVQFTILNQLSSDRDRLESKYGQLLSWSTGANNAVAFLQDVVQINVAHYDATLVSDTVEKRPDLGGADEQILKYSLISSDSKFDVIFRFRDDQLSRYQIVLVKGSPVYAEPQPANLLDSTKRLLERLETYKNEAYLDNMSKVAASFNTLANSEITEGNIKLSIVVSGNESTIWWMYTENGVDFEAKSLRMVYEDGVLTDLLDGWYLFTIGNTKVDVTADRAIEIARDAVKNFTWQVNGIAVSGFNVLSEPVSVTFHPNPREVSLALIPYWQVILYLDNVYAGGVTRLAVGVWADTGAVAQITTQTG